VVSLEATFAKHAEAMGPEAREALVSEPTRSAREAEESIIKMMPWLDDSERGEAIALHVELRTPLYGRLPLGDGRRVGEFRAWGEPVRQVLDVAPRGELSSGHLNYVAHVDRHAGNLSPRHTAPRWTLPAVHGRPTPWTRAATSPPLVGCSAGNSLLAVDRRTKRNPESRETRPSDPVSPRLPGGSDHTPTGSGAKCDR